MIEKEREQREQPFLPRLPRQLRSRIEHIDEASRPCGRFRSPSTIEERLRARFDRSLLQLGVGSPLIEESSPVPANWQRLIDHLHAEGIIASPHITIRPQRNDRPKLYNLQLVPPQPGERTDGRQPWYSGFGGSFDFEEALGKTIGETLERYFFSIYKRKDFRHASAASLRQQGLKILDTRTLGGFSTEQQDLFPHLRVTDETPLYWLEGEQWGEHGSFLLPSQLVFWNYAHGDEHLLARPTTSGCAGHFTKEEAVLAAVLELIQRDAFLVFWLNSIAPPQLDLSGLSSQRVQDLRAMLARYRLDATFLDTTSDIGVPAVTCILVDRTSAEPVVSIGSSCGFDVEANVFQSTIEALINNAYIATLPQRSLPPDYRPFTLTDTQFPRTDRLATWKGSAALQRMSFLLSGPKKKLTEHALKSASPKAQLRHVQDTLRSLGNGYEIYIYEPRHRALSAIGYHVVRAIVPQLIPLYFSEQAAPLASLRLQSVPERLGYKPATELNPLPHPFP